MYPNEKFSEYFPDAVMPEELPEAYRSCCLRIGSYVIIRKVMDEYDLPKMLGKFFGPKCGLFLDLVSYMIVEEENVGQYYPDFAFSHPLFSEGMRIYSDPSVSRFLKSISRDQIIGFQEDWNARRDHRQRIYLSYDSTNKNCDAGDIDLIEFGKAKDAKGVPVFNIAIAFDKTNRIPLFYEEYPGSITDVSQFVYMVDKVKDYGYRNVGFILDRGYFSKENIQYMDANGYAFIIMVKGCKSLVSSIILENRNTFETERECSIRSYKVYGKTVEAVLYEDDALVRWFHIYFNPSKQAAERELLEQRIDKLKQYLEKHIGEDTRFGKTYTDLFDLTYNSKGKLCSVQERSDVIQRELKLCGYFCIITSEKMTASQALIQYKGRDMSEKLFRTDKTFIGSGSNRAHSNETHSAKTFVEFIALIVRNRIYNLLKDTMLKLESSPNYMTVPAALRELEKIEMVRRSNGRYRLDHAVSKRQKTILSAFGLNDMDIRSAAVEISNLLTNNQSLLEAAAKEDEDGQNEVDYYD
ncbi:MAG: transposase [Mogibacterium sp.]|nr:transposase [Mogibacterium sp.]